MHRRRKSMRHGGFTLIELLVAITIMAVMAVIAWRGLDGMQQATQQTRTHSDAVLALDAGLSQWSADLDALSESTNGLPAALDWDGRALRITRRHSVDPTEGVLVVAWTRGNRDGADQWLRWQSEPVRSLQAWQSAWNLAAQWAQSPSQNAKRQEVAIAPLAQWQIYYFRGGAWSNPLSSTGATEPSGTAGPVPPANNAASVPDGVRLVLTVPAPHPLAGALTRDWARPTLIGGAP